MAKHRLVVFTNALPGRDDDFNAWYDQVHLKEVLEIDGFEAAQRFAVSDAQVEAGGDPVAAPGRYLAIYEFDGDDPKAVLDRLTGSADRMDMGDSLDTSSAQAFAFSAIGDRRSE